MTKEQLIEMLDEYEDGEEIDLAEILREQEERRARLIEEIEERQHNNGFYTFQYTLEMYRRER